MPGRRCDRSTRLRGVVTAISIDGASITLIALTYPSRSGSGSCGSGSVASRRGIRAMNDFLQLDAFSRSSVSANSCFLMFSSIPCLTRACFF